MYHIMSILFDQYPFRHTLLYEIKVIKKYETQKQLWNLDEKHQILIGYINKWLKVQLAYIPKTGLCVATTISQLLAAKKVPLFLPSSLVLTLQSTSGFSKILAHEVQLCVTQADDALADIQHHLCIISGLWHSKKVNISGTGNIPNTHMLSLFNCFNHHMKQSILCYRAAHSALLAANLGQQWQDMLNELSWIRLVPQSRSEVDMDISKQVFDEGLQVEWSKSLERKMQWEQEVHINQEEMQ